MEKCESGAEVPSKGRAGKGAEEGINTHHCDHQEREPGRSVSKPPLVEYPTHRAYCQTESAVIVLRFVLQSEFGWHPGEQSLKSWGWHGERFTGSTESLRAAPKTLARMLSNRKASASHDEECRFWEYLNSAVLFPMPDDWKKLAAQCRAL